MPMTVPLTTDELLTTTRAVRRRLDFTRPVPRSLVEECLECAIQAPTAGNGQYWEFMVVEDAAKKQVIAEHYPRRGRNISRCRTSFRTFRSKARSVWRNRSG
jgi:nitroreductase